MIAAKLFVLFSITATVDVKNLILMVTDSHESRLLITDQ